MTAQSFVTPLEAADWFYKKASAAEMKISEDKLQHLLFLAQIHFSLKEGRHLMPTLFICGRSGFYEASIRSTLKSGMPLMPQINIEKSIKNFLELIWQKYAPFSDSALDNFIWSLDCWKQHYRPEKETIIDPVACTDSFAASLHKNSSSTQTQNKILISQNGPVKVSAWQPRKLDSSKNKEKH